MSKENLFDGISRILASGISRRRAFRLIAGAVASGTAVSFLDPQRAYATACVNIDGRCSGDCCPGSPPCKPFTPTGTIECCSGGLFGACGNVVDTGFCTTCLQATPMANATCSKGHCCPTGQFWNGTMCKKPNTAKAVVAAVQPGPPMQLALTAQDSTYGIAKISVGEAVNCNITPAIPMAAGGTTSAIALTATKIHHCKPARITLALTDPSGDIENKHILFSVLKLSTGKWVRQTFSDLLQEQAHLTLTNGSFGFTILQVWVNSTLQHTLSLTNNQTLTLDLFYEMITEKREHHISGRLRRTRCQRQHHVDG